MYDEIKKELFLYGNISALDDSQLLDLIEKVYRRQAQTAVTDEDCAKTARRVFQTLRGLGVLDGFLKDDSVSEIMVNGYRDIYIEKDGRLQKTETAFESEKDLMDTIQRVVGSAGREVNQASPIVDTRLRSGERVNVVLPPVSLNGPAVTIRRFPKDRITMTNLVEYASITEEAADFLKKLVLAKYNIFISGGTSSGKTTFLNALSDFIPKTERIITIEDSAELQLTGLPNLVRLETRNANTAGVGEITMQSLIKTSLRMRPERIIVGEVRGPEAIDMLGAMNTGHDGSLSTGHANSCADMLNRLENMVLQGNSGLPLLAIRQNIASSIDIMVHLRKLEGRRCVSEISELVGVKDSQIVMNKLFTLNRGHLVPTGSRLKHTYKLENYGVEL